MDGFFTRRRLPHWDVPVATYFVTSCLAGSIPAIGLRELQEYRDLINARPRPETMSLADWERYKHKLIFAKLDEWLDGKPAVRRFENADIAKIVQDSLYHFAGVRYHLLAYVIMPSHLHWVFHPIEPVGQGARLYVRAVRPGEKPAPRTAPGGTPAPRRIRSPREKIMHSMKSFTSHQCVRVLKQKQPFWQDESYDHWVRDDDELLRIIEYIEQNPVKAGLVASADEFQFSSAFDRRQFGIALGDPLIRRRGAGVSPVR
jgi:type I restriction enzyme R subunit